ncbi:hypothetical protein QBC33DRAFT_546773 [Phialemonium atrogriseum]|uniref:Uncharacterized protein n=1 Tax=Phialemonium atrogriseum TaxID=1093897 RepID=A0AAJ0BUC6_9PEZI|nr:uncharacterized protein QBC33DRAFT_546773 [Phialemonium atrogriseum]KAK1764664.1 hypothetical protein QBC33DRAFT_546773 [Phialemonium atrogriseum]
MTASQNIPVSSSEASIEHLDLDHYSSFVRAISNILSTEIAEATITQLADGLPTRAMYSEARGSFPHRDHPILKHTELCEGASAKAKEFLVAFDPMILRFDATLLQAYQDTSPGSRQFGIRLIEMTAVAIHQIAVALYQLDEKAHRGDIDSVMNWVAPIEQYELHGRWETKPHFPPRPSLFFHPDYLDHHQYPSGTADVAGYWAEDRIFGGVVLFDRGKSDMEAKEVYFHSGRRRQTHRVWLLLEPQLESLISFLLDESGRVESPLPIFVDEKSRKRFDAWDAMAFHHIFRDRWERSIPDIKDESSIRYNTGDYPELQDVFDKLAAGPSYDVPGRFDPLSTNIEKHAKETEGSGPDAPAGPAAQPSETADHPGSLTTRSTTEDDIMRLFGETKEAFLARQASFINGPSYDELMQNFLNEPDEGGPGASADLANQRRETS